MQETDIAYDTVLYNKKGEEKPQPFIPAEREGFEPSVPDGYNGFRDRPVRPLRHLSLVVLDSNGKIN